MAIINKINVGKDLETRNKTLILSWECKLVLTAWKSLEMCWLGQSDTDRAPWQMETSIEELPP